MRSPIKALTIIFIYISLAPSYSQKLPDWDFQFPLDVNAFVSGSFGELRTGHFHSGIDFTTLGRTGLAVRSIDYGHVSRIVVSPVGYGKAIYIDHSNGYTSVYAHLNSFAPKIEAIITNLQYQKESFAIEEHFNPGEIVLKKGEIIAYSGNTGSSGGPHLHFEIRETQQQKPVNVQFFNLPIKDDVPPHIEAVCIYPLDKNSRINGKNTPLYLPAVKIQGSYFLKGNPPITASGTIGIGIETLDYLTGSWRKCGVYSISLNVDGKQWFESRLDGFLFSQTRYLNSHIDYGMKQKNGRTIQKSFLDENNKLEIYHVTPQQGRINMEAGSQKVIEYKISDAAGNLSRLEFKITGIPSPLNLESSIPLQPMTGARKPYHYKSNNFSVHFPANSFYTDVPSLFEVSPNNGTGIGNHFTVLDESIPVHNFFEISIPIPEENLNIKGLVGAKLNNKNGLVFAGGKRDDNRWIIRTRDPGVYCLAIDTIAPTLRVLQMPQGHNYTQRDAIRIEIKDNFSGINNYRCTINSNWALFEYDPKNKVLIGFFQRLRIRKGVKHALEVTATDQAGNTKVLKINFVY